MIYGGLEQQTMPYDSHNDDDIQDDLQEGKRTRGISVTLGDREMLTLSAICEDYGYTRSAAIRFLCKAFTDRLEPDFDIITFKRCSVSNRIKDRVTEKSGEHIRILRSDMKES